MGENQLVMEKPIEFLKHILKTYTPSGFEEPLANFYKKFLQIHGFKIIESEIGNVIAIKGKGSPTLLISSHMDTVSPKLPFKETKTHLFARGAVDCKSAWASMIYSAAKTNWDEIFSLNNNSGTIILCGVVKEEDSTVGIEDLFNTSLKPNYAIFGEPTFIDRICYAYRGRIWLRIKSSGEQGHASSSWNYTNPIEVILSFWEEIKKLGTNYKTPLEEGDACSHFDETTITLTKIHAGDIGNSTPETCEADIDIRIPPSLNLDDFLGEIEQKKSIVEKIFSTSIDIEYESRIPGVITETKTPLLNALRWSIFKETGNKAKILKKTGTTFMNSIKTHYNIPTIVYGPGNPKLEHTDKEMIEKEEYLRSIEIYKRFYPKFFKMVGNGKN